MKLIQFIKALEHILENVDNPESVDVKMADCISVATPILKENTVFITDSKE